MILKDRSWDLLRIIAKRGSSHLLVFNLVWLSWLESVLLLPEIRISKMKMKWQMQECHICNVRCERRMAFGLTFCSYIRLFITSSIMLAIWPRRESIQEKGLKYLQTARNLSLFIFLDALCLNRHIRCRELELSFPSGYDCFSSEDKCYVRRHELNTLHKIIWKQLLVIPGGTEKKLYIIGVGDMKQSYHICNKHIRKIQNNWSHSQPCVWERGGGGRQILLGLKEGQILTQAILAERRRWARCNDRQYLGSLIGQ